MMFPEHDFLLSISLTYVLEFSELVWHTTCETLSKKGCGS
jgi:hypothetical protein